MRRCASDAQKLEQLRRLIREIEYLKYTLNSTLYWDKMTYMPEKGLTYRSEVMSFLGAQLYERFRSPELRSLVDHFSRQKDAPPQVSAMVRRVESNYIYINKIPQAEYQAYIALIAKAEQVWEQAREANDFQRFAPYLERIVDTFRAFAGYWGYEAEPYDALMSFYEPGTTVQQMDRLADELKHFVIDLFQTLQARGMPCGEPAEGRFRLPLEEQRALSQYVLETIGFDFASGRLDEGSHPTTLAASPGDVRVITSYQAEDFRSGLFNTLHEGGMGLMNRILIRLCWGCFWAKWHPLPPSWRRPVFTRTSLAGAPDSGSICSQECSSSAPHWLWASGRRSFSRSIRSVPR